MRKGEILSNAIDHLEGRDYDKTWHAIGEIENMVQSALNEIKALNLHCAIRELEELLEGLE